MLHVTKERLNILGGQIVVDLQGWVEKKHRSSQKIEYTVAAKIYVFIQSVSAEIGTAITTVRGSLPYLLLCPPTG